MSSTKEQSIELITDELVKEKEIRRSDFSVVFCGTYRGRKVAIKEIINNQTTPGKDDEDITRDVKLLEKCHHEAVVEFIGAVFTPDKQMIVTELCEYGPLNEAMDEYLEEFNKLHKRTSAHMFNMFIMKKNILDGYCTWLFDILFELEKRMKDKEYDQFHSRFYGRVSELLLDVYLNTNNLKYTEVKFMDMENINWWKKGTSFLKAKFLGKKYEKSF